MPFDAMSSRVPIVAPAVAVVPGVGGRGGL